MTTFFSLSRHLSITLSLLLWIIFLDPGFAYGVDSSCDSLMIVERDKRILMVFFSGVFEGYTIYNPDKPLPYLGLGHFYQKKWAEGVFYLSSELGLMKLRQHYRDKRGLRNFRLYRNVSSESIYYRSGMRGLSPQEGKYHSFFRLSNHSLFYFRRVDFYSFYRILHSKTAKINKIRMNNESTASLLLSPFKWRYLKNPWVYIPVVIGGVSTYFLTKQDLPLSKAEKITMFGKEYSPQKSAWIERGVQSYRFAMVAGGEEMYFRGVVQTELTERIDQNLAWVVSSLLFGAFHIPNNGYANGISAFLGGLYFGYRYKSNGFDIGEPIALHFWLNWVARSVEFIRNPRDGHLVYSISWKL